MKLLTFSGLLIALVGLGVLANPVNNDPAAHEVSDIESRDLLGDIITDFVGATTCFDCEVWHPCAVGDSRSDYSC
jgi:hypothetical protein